MVAQRGFAIIPSWRVARSAHFTGANSLVLIVHPPEFRAGLVARMERWSLER
jgi:hypothetical protein